MNDLDNESHSKFNCAYMLMIKFIAGISMLGTDDISGPGELRDDSLTHLLPQDGENYQEKGSNMRENGAVLPVTNKHCFWRYYCKIRTESDKILLKKKCAFHSKSYNEMTNTGKMLFSQNENGKKMKDSMMSKEEAMKRLTSWRKTVLVRKRSETD